MSCRSLLLLAFLVAAGCPRAPTPPPSGQTGANADDVSSVSPPATEERHDFVGSATCRECHADEHASYLLTTHSRALQKVNLADEPPDVTFTHELSGRRYEVVRRDGELVHREVLAGDSRSEVGSEYVMHYAIGSGHHSRSYAGLDDGFLFESPITWYASRDGWEVSPGYDRPQHWGFERAVDDACLVCHSGGVEAIGGSQRVRFHELAIGCEQCHGPGGEHVRRRRDERAGETVDPIVQPRSLARSESEAICAQCHLRGDATVLRPGKPLGDFRPGQPLSEYRIDYVLDRPHREMEVVGHMEQMWASACYQQSETLSCITCHDLHSAAPPEDRVSYFRDRCLECHETGDCHLETFRRLELSPRDDCVQCHMPRSDTDIPHFAFTHHRIAVHDEAVDRRETSAIADLIPLQTIDHLPEDVRRRSLGLAYWEVAQGQADPPAFREYQDRARDLLQTDEFKADSVVLATLAQMDFAVDPERAAANARRAITDPGLDQRARVNALFVIAAVALRSGRYVEAIGALEELTTLRRHSEDWFLLGQSRQAIGDPQAGAALQRALEIHPFRPDVTQALLTWEERAGRLDRVAALRRRLSLLSRR